jgi:hypothetical protein
MSSNGLVLTILTALTWVVLALVLSTVIGGNGTGDIDIFLGMRWMLAGVLIFALWIWLGGLLLIAGGQGILPRWVVFAALILVPASAASAYGGLYLASELKAGWPMTIAMTVPPLIAAYSIALYQPSLRRAAASFRQAK